MACGDSSAARIERNETALNDERREIVEDMGAAKGTGDTGEDSDHRWEEADEMLAAAECCIRNFADQIAALRARYQKAQKGSTDHESRDRAPEPG
jgi:hypothetical protein